MRPRMPEAIEGISRSDAAAETPFGGTLAGFYKEVEYNRPPVSSAQ